MKSPYIKLNNGDEFPIINGSLYYFPKEELKFENIFFLDLNEVCYVNFPNSFAIKSLQYFDTLSEEIIFQLVSKFNKNPIFQLTYESFLLKLLVSILSLLKNYNILIISNVGLTNESTLLIKNYLEKHLKEENQKSIILIDEYR